MGCSGSKADDNGLATAWGNGGAGGGKPRDKGRKGRHSKHRGSEDSRSASSSEESRGRRRVLGDDYTLGLTLGRGHYGWVYKGKCKRSGRQVAVKVIDRSKSRPKRCGGVVVWWWCGSHNSSSSVASLFSAPLSLLQVEAGGGHS